ncbi:MAG: flippase-like domain-containing protein [Acidobacteriota bacterium]|nr:flippase-like domain-containing protein [Acidobacteriota bacterium]
MDKNNSNNTTNNRKKKLARIILTAFGLMLLAVLIWRAGPKVVWENIVKAGYYLPLVCLIALTWMFLQAIAWSIVQSAFQKVPLMTLFRAKIMADGLGTLVPIAANIGGEAARAVIIKPHSPLNEGIPGIVFDKTIEYFASLAYLAAGLLLSLIYLKIPQKLEVSSLVALGIITIVLVIMVILQLKGVYPIVERLAGISHHLRRWFEQKEASLKDFDRNMRLMFSHSKTGLLLVFLLHFTARCLGALEIYVIIRAMGWPASLVKVVFISVFTVIINTAFFVIPGQWGAAEGGSLLAAATVGYPVTIGLSVGLIRRLRKIFFAVLTVILTAAGKHKQNEKLATENANGR